MSKKDIQAARIFTLLAAGLLGSLAHADFPDFTNAAGGNTWETPGNWSTDPLLPSAGNNSTTSFSADATLQSNQSVRRLNEQAGGQTLTINSGGTLLSQGNATEILGDGFSLVIEDGGTYTRNSLGPVTTDFTSIGLGSTVTVNNGGTYSVIRNDTRVALGHFVVNGSDASMSFVNIFTSDPADSSGRNDTFSPNNSTITLNGGTLTVTGTMRWDTIADTVFTVGAGSTLKLTNGGASHIFADGLQVNTGGILEAAGTLTLGGTGPELTVDGSSFLSVGGATGSGIASLDLTGYDALFSDGATYDYTLNPSLGTEDSFTADTLALGDIDLRLTIGGGLPSDFSDSYVLFNFSALTDDGGTPITNQAQLDALTANWTVLAGVNTAVRSIPVFEFQSGQIILTNFASYQVPEPSTLVLFGLGFALLRRRILSALQGA